MPGAVTRSAARRQPGGDAGLRRVAAKLAQTLRGAARWALCAAAPAAFASGCGAESASGIDEPEVGAPCTSELDCPVGSRCDDGGCTDGVAPGVQVDLVFEPPSHRADLAPLQIASMIVRAGRALPDYALRPPTAVSGVVLFNAAGAGVGAPVSAEVRFTQRAPVEARGVVAAARTDLDGLYAVQVPPGVYDVRVDPDRHDVATSLVRDVVVGIGTEFQPFSVPAPEQYVVAAGKVERGTDAIEPVANVVVSATTVDGGWESTSFVTGDDGSFRVFVPPAQGPWVFTATPALAAVDAPTATFEPVDIVAGATASVDLRLGDLPPRRVLDVVVTDSDGAARADAVVAVRTLLRPTRGSTRGPGLVDGFQTWWASRAALDEAEGVHRFEIAATTVDVFAASTDPAYGPAVPVVATLRDDTVTTVDLPLAARRPVPLTVRDARGDAVPGAVVRAELAETGALPLRWYGVPSSLYDSTAQTDLAGTAVLQLSPGSWKVDVLPTGATRLARGGAVIAVGATQPEPVAVAIPDAGTVSGRILDDGNEPLAGVRVAAYRDGHLLADATTDALGQYTLLVPMQ